MKTVATALLSAQTGGIWFLNSSAPDALVRWSDLAARAERVAGGLHAAGVRPGDRAAVAVADSRAFLDALFGIVLAGAVPVPLFPPNGLSALDTWFASTGRALSAVEARWMVADSALARLAPSLHLDCPTLRAVLRVDDLDEPCPDVRADPNAPALIQLTSGSTAAPRGVVVRPDNLDANICALVDRLGGSDDVCVSWLPLYHDMGLVGHLLGTLWGSSSIALMSPFAFLKRPSAWLRAISERRGTVSFAPNFAYGLAARRVTDAEIEELDLSSWRVAGCGAEPIDPTTLARFAERLAPASFRAAALLPCYGMAEHTLAVTVPQVGRGLVVKRGFVGCGRPFPGHTVEIVGPDGALMPEGSIGEIVAAGPSLAPGYIGEASVRERLHTGDLGFVEEGELFVCGRIKDLIIVRGRNYYPHDIERIAATVGGVRPGGAAAFAVPGRDTEDAVVLVEASDPSVAADVAAVVRDETGLAVEVVIVPPRTLPKTSSGKIRRAEARARYLAGRLEVAPGRGLVWHIARAGLGRVSGALRRLGS